MLGGRTVVRQNVWNIRFGALLFMFSLWVGYGAHDWWNRIEPRSTLELDPRQIWNQGNHYQLLISKLNEMYTSIVMVITMKKQVYLAAKLICVTFTQKLLIKISLEKFL